MAKGEQVGRECWTAGGAGGVVWGTDCTERDGRGSVPGRSKGRDDGDHRDFQPVVECVPDLFRILKWTGRIFSDEMSVGSGRTGQ